MEGPFGSIDSRRAGAGFAMALLAAWMGLSGCADRTAGGNSSGTGNTLTGCLRDGSGAPVTGASVVARTLQWRPEDSLTEVVVVRVATDSSGRFVFADLPSETWVLEASGRSGGCLFAPVVLGPEAGVVDLGTVLSGQPGPWVGRVRGDSLPARLAGTIRIAGTSHRAALRTDGTFRLEDVPPGQARLVVEAGDLRGEASERIPVRELRDSLFVNVTTDRQEDYSLWPGRRVAVIDASAAGGYIGSDLARVPLLVRLDALTLPAWDPAGSSLRFSDGAGSHFPYEIESWNAASREALVWVRVDSLNKGSLRRSLVMHWGREGAPSRSDGGAVFDTAEGWLGAWHLSGSRPLRNATGLGDLAVRGIRLVASPEGGVDLDAASLMEWHDPRLARTGGTSVSVLARIESAPPSGAFLIRQGNPDSAAFDWALALRDSQGTLQAGFSTRLQWGAPFPELTRGAVPRATWVLLGGVFDTASQRVRLELPDGVNRSALARDTLRRREPDPSLLVGGGATARIDEIRLLAGPVHPDFLRAQGLSIDRSVEFLRWQE